MAIHIKYYTNVDKGITIAVIRDNRGIAGKGKSQCAPCDNFDMELGRQIAAKRAWINSYKNAIKINQHYLNDIQESIDFLTKKQEDFNRRSAFLMNNLQTKEKELIGLIK